MDSDPGQGDTKLKQDTFSKTFPDKLNKLSPTVLLLIQLFLHFQDRFDFDFYLLDLDQCPGKFRAELYPQHGLPQSGPKFGMRHELCGEKAPCVGVTEMGWYILFLNSNFFKLVSNCNLHAGPCFNNS